MAQEPGRAPQSHVCAGMKMPKLAAAPGLEMVLLVASGDAVSHHWDGQDRAKASLHWCQAARLAHRVALSAPNHPPGTLPAFI